MMLPKHVSKPATETIAIVYYSILGSAAIDIQLEREGMRRRALANNTLDILLLEPEGSNTVCHSP